VNRPGEPRRTVALEVKVVTDPAGQPGVLIQFEHGWLVVSPPNARRIATLLLDVADEAEGHQ
jgi:hypothetical protein